MHILIAEDDVPLARFLSSGLEAEHYNVRTASAGREVQNILQEGACDLIILDTNLTDVNGMEVLRQVRSTRPHLPVLVLSGNSRVEDRVSGLDSGADDYLTKPFAFSELCARVRALLRRSCLPFEATLRCLDLELDRVRRTVTRGERLIELTPKEFALLEFLMLNSGRAVSRASVIHQVWRLSADTLTNVVDVYINYLRKKVDAGAKQAVIHTIRGAGYRLGPKQQSGA